MQLADVISIVVGIMAVGVPAYLAVQRNAQAARDREIDRRLEALEREANRRLDALERTTAEAVARLHLDELETVKLQGDQALIKQSHDHVQEDIAEIKDRMATREDTVAIGRRIDDLANLLRMRTPTPPSRYATPGSDPHVPAVKPTR